MFQHTTVNRQTDNKTDNNRRLTFTSITMDKVIYVDWVTGGKVWGCTGGNVRGTTTNHDGLGGRTISNEVDSCGGRGWLTSVGSVIGESGSGAKFVALTARLRCQE